MDQAVKQTAAQSSVLSGMRGKITLFRKLKTLIAWHADSLEHVYLHDQDLVMQDGRLLQVGGCYQGLHDTEIDGRDLMAMPGLINLHSHPASEPGNRGLLEEVGSPKLGQSSLYEYMPIFRMDQTYAPHAMRVAIGEMLKSGVTTYVDMSTPRENWVEEVADTGIRGVLGPMYRSAIWRTSNGYSVDYAWDEEMGRKGLAAAIDIAIAASKHPSGRVSAMLCPSQIDTCSVALLEASRDAAAELGVRLQIHAAQSLIECQEMMRRHGRTPIEWLDDMGLLNDNLIIGHGIFLNDHPSVALPQAHDFDLLVASGASVAHCPTVFARRGIALNHFGRYEAAGIRMGIGTDTFPHNMLDEMRMAIYTGRLMSRDYTTASTRSVFNAATVTAASILGRRDIGRLEAGCQADFSLIDLNHAYMRPNREPLRSLLYSAGDRAVRDVYVAGNLVVSGGELMTIDIERALTMVEEGQSVTIARAPGNDYAGRTIDQLSPRVFNTIESLGR